jgi:hypothetical protein
MSNIVKVGRLHLVDRFGYTWLLWGVLALTFLVNLAIYAMIPTTTNPTGNYTGALITIYIFMAIIGVGAATKFLPFAFTLGVSRRTYYLGTIALVLGLCLLYSGILTVLWWVEGLTNGWGLQLHFFRVPWILDGPWYQAWLTSFALLSLVFLVGLWLGLIYRRFGLTGSVVAYGIVTLIVVAAVMLITWQGAWPAFGRFVVDLDILTASGLVLLVGVVVAAGGYLTIRRITV